MLECVFFVSICKHFFDLLYFLFYCPSRHISPFTAFEAFFHIFFVYISFRHPKSLLWGLLALAVPRVCLLSRGSHDHKPRPVWGRRVASRKLEHVWTRKWNLTWSTPGGLICGVEICLGSLGCLEISKKCFFEEFKDSAMIRVCPGDGLLQQQPVGPSQSASVEGRSASRRWIHPDPTVTNVGTVGREVDQRHTQVVWTNSIAVYLVRWVLLSCQRTYKWAMISNEYISSLQIHFTLNSLDDRSYTCNHPTPLFHTATSDNDLCFCAFHQVAIVQKYQGSKGRVDWIASVMETWIVMDSVWLPAVVPVIIESYVWTLWLYESFLQIALYDFVTMSEMTATRVRHFKAPVAEFQSNLIRSKTNNCIFHLGHHIADQKTLRYAVPRSVTCVATSSRSWSAPTRTTLASWISVVLFIWGNARILPTYSKFVDITYVIGPRETLKLYILANIPPSLKPKGDERWNSERWLRAHIVTLSQVLAVATEESFFSTRRIFSAGNVWAETNFRRLTSNQGDFCVAQKENIDILEYALKGKHSNRTRDC